MSRAARMLPRMTLDELRDAILLRLAESGQAATSALFSEYVARVAAALNPPPPAV